MKMSDIFSGLSGFRFPDARINGGGPLPTELSGPAGINGDPDGRINFNDALLSGITPYQYNPGTGRMGSDRSYQQIPHRKQFFIPKLYLPDATGKYKIQVSHPVDQGDIAFRININTNVNFLLQEGNHIASNNHDSMLDVFCNLTTANYMIKGMLLHGDTEGNLWKVLYRNLAYGKVILSPEPDMITKCEFFLQTFVPLGICAGSEKQGGLHETGIAPVQAACSHITTMTLDGQSRDLVNYWQNIDLCAGDVLIFRIGLKKSKTYVLNHYYKGIVSQTFQEDPVIPWLQLIPHVLRVHGSDTITDDMSDGIPSHRRREVIELLNFWQTGYWRVAQTFTCKRRYSTKDQFCDDTEFMKGQLLQVTFAPVLVSGLENFLPAASSLVKDIKTSREKFFESVKKRHETREKNSRAVLNVLRSVENDVNEILEPRPDAEEQDFEEQEFEEHDFEEQDPDILDSAKGKKLRKDPRNLGEGGDSQKDSKNPGENADLEGSSSTSKKPLDSAKGSGKVPEQGVQPNNSKKDDDISIISSFNETVSKKFQTPIKLSNNVVELHVSSLPKLTYEQFKTESTENISIKGKKKGELSVTFDEIILKCVGKNHTQELFHYPVIFGKNFSYNASYQTDMQNYNMQLILPCDKIKKDLKCNGQKILFSFKIAQDDAKMSVTAVFLTDSKTYLYENSYKIELVKDDATSCRIEKKDLIIEQEQDKQIVEQMGDIVILWKRPPVRYVQNFQNFLNLKIGDFDCYESFQADEYNKTFSFADTAAEISSKPSMSKSSTRDPMKISYSKIK